MTINTGGLARKKVWDIVWRKAMNRASNRVSTLLWDGIEDEVVIKVWFKGMGTVFSRVCELIRDH